MRAYKKFVIFDFGIVLLFLFSLNSYSQEQIVQAESQGTIQKDNKEMGCKKNYMK